MEAKQEHAAIRHQGIIARVSTNVFYLYFYFQKDPDKDKKGYHSTFNKKPYPNFNG